MHPATTVPAYANEDAMESSISRDSDPPPSYSEIHSPSYVLNQQTPYYNASNYGACPAAPPPPYTPSPSYSSPTSGHRTQKSEGIPESGVMIPLSMSSSTLQTEESPGRKKYAAYICCAVFLIIVLFAAYIGHGNRKPRSHYRYNFDWNS